MRRLRFVWRFLKFSVSPLFRWFALVYALIGAINLLKSEFLPVSFSEYRMLKFLPDWSIQTWLLIFSGMLIVAILEALYAQYENDVTTKSKRLITAAGVDWIRPRHPFSKSAITTFIVCAVLVLALWVSSVARAHMLAGQPRFISYLKPEQARLAITKIEFISPDKSSQAPTPPPYDTWFNVWFGNQGKPSARLMVIQGTLRITGGSTLTKEEEEIEQDKLRSSNLGVASKQLSSEIYQSDSEQFVSFPDRLDKAAQLLHQEAGNILAGKNIVYLFVAIKYQDQTMPPDVIGITEACTWYSRLFDVRHTCGSNRSFLYRLGTDRP